MGKENTAIKTQVDRVFRTIVDEIMKGPKATSWSATMPPYCYTVLCLDPKYRPGGEAVAERE